MCFLLSVFFHNISSFFLHAQLQWRYSTSGGAVPLLDALKGAAQLT